MPIGAAGGLLFMRREKVANVFSFGAAALSALSGLLAALVVLGERSGDPRAADSNCCPP